MPVHLPSPPRSIFNLGELDLIAVEGPQAAAYLNRLCTLDTVRLPVGAGDRPFLLDAKGKIQSAFSLSRIGPDLLWASTPAGHGARFIELLEHYHFGEAVTFEIVHDQAAVGLGGEEAEALLNELGLPCPADPLSVADGQHLEIPVRVIRNDHLGAPSWELWSADVIALSSALEAAGAQGLEPSAVTALRIQSMRPEWPNEYGPHSSPLEVSGLGGLTDAKGCYPGQEVIERTLSLGRPPRILARLEARGQVCEGAEVSHGGKKAGRVTSVASHPDGPAACLALLRRKTASVGQILMSGATEFTVLELR